MKIDKKKILCFGEVLWDNLPGGPKPGGAPMNVALHLKQFSHQVFIASKIGADPKGFELRAFLAGAGMDIEALQVDTTLPTSEVLIQLDEQNNPTYEICEPVAWDNIELTSALAGLSEHADLIIYGSLASRNETSRNTLMCILDRDCTKVMDVNLRPPYDKKEVAEPLMQRADIIKLNEHELEQVVNKWNEQNISKEDEQIAWLAVYFKSDMVCVTKGEEGAVLYHNGRLFRHPGFKVTTVDNVGAGDAFLAGFISSYLDGVNDAKALEFACATGAYVASKPGATPKYKLEEIRRIMQQ